jgi:hypothetical protein
VQFVLEVDEFVWVPLLAGQAGFALRLSSAILPLAGDTPIRGGGGGGGGGEEGGGDGGRSSDEGRVGER